MRRATRFITLLAVLALVGMSLAAPAYAEGPHGNPSAGVTDPENHGPEGTNGPNGKGGGKGGTGDEGNEGKKNPSKSQEDPSGNEPNNSSANSEAATQEGDGEEEEEAAKGKPDGAGKPEGDGGGSGGKPENDMSGKSSGPAERSPPGNNGTIKVHDQGPQVHSDVEVRRNEPHVGCVFHLYGFHFDAGQSGSWRIEAWPPTGTRGTVVASGTWSATAQGDWQSGPITLSEGHHKLFFGTFDGHNKMKVFWVEGCAPPDEGDDEGDEEQPDKVTVCVELGNGEFEERERNEDAPPFNNEVPMEECNVEEDDDDDEGGDEEQPDKVTVCVELGNGEFEERERNENAPPHQNEVPMEECNVEDDDDEDVGGADKVWVCHITGSGWVKIHIAREGWENGHSKHEGDVMAETEEGLPEDCDLDEDIDDDGDNPPSDDDNPPSNDDNPPADDDEDEDDNDRDSRRDNDDDDDEDEDEDEAGAQRDVRTDTVCIANTIMDRTFVNGSLTSVKTTGAACQVLGFEQSPGVAVVTPIIETVAPAVMAVLGLLPSSATLNEDPGRLALAGLALMAAVALLLLRRRTRRST